MKDNISNPEDINKWANISRSVLNGIVGDYLAKENNPLAIEMAFYHHGHPLILNETLAHQLRFSSGKPLTNKVIVLIHGLTNLETVWNFTADLNTQHVTQTLQGTQDEQSNDSDPLNFENNDLDNYGFRLQRDFGYTPLFLRYNTGLSIKENGQNLSDLLTELVKFYPIQIDELVLMGFSMGGLLIRSAQKLAQESKTAWLDKLSNCYYIGTPHEGSPFEKFGHLTSAIVRSIPQEYVSHWADWIDMRSEGIQDLKEGLLHLKDDYPHTVDEDDPYVQSVRCGSFIPSAQHHFVSGSLSENKASLLNKFFGDSLVRHSSANPISAPKDCKTAHFDGIPHIPLAHSETVYQQLSDWFSVKPLEEKDIISLKYYTVPNDIAYAEIKPGSQDLSSQEIISGIVDLLAKAYDHTVDSMETVQNSIADESFSLLNKIPVVSEVTKPIEGIHKDILNTIYYSLKAGGKVVHKGSSLLIPSKNVCK